MDVCILDQNSEVLVHRHRQTSPEAFLHVLAPYRQGMVVAVECMFTWDWLADLCADAGIPFVLGHALSMKALHGGKAKNDQSDSQKMAALLRGGMLPQSSVSPAAMRATRDLLQHRMPLARQRAELLAHVQHTHSQYHLPAMGTKIASKANRDGVAERWADPAVPKSIEVARARITYDDALLRDVDLPIVNTAKHHAAHTLYLRHTVPGIGTILRLVWLYDIHDIDRFPRVQEVVSSCRLVPCAQESAGKRFGTSGAKIGHAHLKWAFAEAAVLFLRDHPPAQTSLARLEKQQDKGQALTVLAHTLARAVYDLLTRHVAFEREKFFQRSWRGADAPGASLDKHGMNRLDALDTAASAASLHAKARRGRDPLSPALCLAIRSRSCLMRR